MANMGRMCKQAAFVLVHQRGISELAAWRWLRPNHLPRTDRW